MDSASLVRKKIKAQRKALSVDEICQKSARMADHLAEFVGFKHAEHVAYYLPISGEADPTILCDKFNKMFYLPVLHKVKKNELHFVKTDAQSKLILNKFGIAEPEHSAINEIKANQLDLVIMPLVSFDKQGNRIGMGGGFYDRTFAFKQNIKQGKNGLKPLLIGYAYEFQYSDKLKPEYWDVKMDGVVTEKGFFYC